MEETKELQKVKRILRKSNSVSLHYTITMYLDGTAKANFNSKHFFEEIAEESEGEKIVNAIEDFYQSCHYSVFKSSMLKVNNEIIKEKIQNPKTSYKQIMYLVDFVSKTYLKDIVDHNFDADDISGSKKLRFALVFKWLEPIFLGPASEVGDKDFAKAKKILLNYCCRPSRTLIEYLDKEKNKPFEPFDFADIWLMKHIIKSL